MLNAILGRPWICVGEPRRNDVRPQTGDSDPSPARIASPRDRRGSQPAAGALAAKLFQQALEEQGLTNQVKRSTHTGSRKALFPKGDFGGETYPDLGLWDSSGGNTIGLRFLARHLITLNFPKRIMYLKRTSVGPLIDEGSSTSAAPGSGRDHEPKADTPGLPGSNP